MAKWYDSNRPQRDQMWRGRHGRPLNLIRRAVFEFTTRVEHDKRALPKVWA